MLSKDDISQIKEIFEPVRDDVSVLKNDIGILKKEFGTLKKDIGTLKKDMAETRKDVKVLIAYFDREYVELRKRIDRIEEYLDLDSKN